MSTFGSDSYSGSDFSGAAPTIHAPRTPATPSAVPKISGNTISWVPVFDATSYVVQRSSDGGTTWVTVATTQNTSYQDPALGYGNSFQYRVQASGITSITTSFSPNLVTAVPTPYTRIGRLPIRTTQIAGTGVAGSTNGDALSSLLTSFPGGPGVYGDGGTALSPDGDTLYFLDGSNSGCIRSLTHLRDPALRQLTAPISTGLNSLGMINGQLRLHSGNFYVAGASVLQVGGGAITPGVTAGVRGFDFDASGHCYWGWSTDPYGWNTPGLGMDGATQIIDMNHVLYLLGARRFCFGPDSQFQGAVCGICWVPPNTLYMSLNGGNDSDNLNWAYLIRVNMDSPYSDYANVIGLGSSGSGGSGYGGISTAVNLNQPGTNFIVAGGRGYIAVYDEQSSESVSVDTGGFSGIGSNARVYYVSNNAIYEATFSGWVVGSEPF